MMPDPAAAGAVEHVDGRADPRGGGPGREGGPGRVAPSRQTFCAIRSYLATAARHGINWPAYRDLRGTLPKPGTGAEGRRGRAETIGG